MKNLKQPRKRIVSLCRKIVASSDPKRKGRIIVISSAKSNPLNL